MASMIVASSRARLPSLPSVNWADQVEQIWRRSDSCCADSHCAANLRARSRSSEPNPSRSPSSSRGAPTRTVLCGRAVHGHAAERRPVGGTVAAMRMIDGAAVPVEGDRPPDPVCVLLPPGATKRRSWRTGGWVLTRRWRSDCRFRRPPSAGARRAPADLGCGFRRRRTRRGVGRARARAKGPRRRTRRACPLGGDAHLGSAGATVQPGGHLLGDGGQCVDLGGGEQVDEVAADRLDVPGCGLL